MAASEPIGPDLPRTEPVTDARSPDSSEWGITSRGHLMKLKLSVTTLALIAASSIPADAADLPNLKPYKPPGWTARCSGPLIKGTISLSAGLSPTPDSWMHRASFA